MTTTSPSSRWIRRFPAAGEARIRLVCFPHAGGSASAYFPLSRVLSPGIETLAVQYPGRQDRYADPCIDDVRELARRTVAALHPWSDRPLALFGHSLGALVAFEAALALQATGDLPPALFVSGRAAPCRTRSSRPLHLASDDDLVANLRRLNGTDATVLADQELLRFLLPAIRADYKAAETYRWDPGQALRCPVSVLNGTADTRVSQAEAVAWSEHTEAETAVHWFSGNHFYLNGNLARVAAVIADRIWSARSTAADRSRRVIA